MEIYGGNMEGMDRDTLPNTSITVECVLWFHAANEKKISI